MKRGSYLTIVFFLIIRVSFAQDAQLSQFYNAPLYLNPAFTGTEQNTRVSTTYRNQWPSSGGIPYTTALACIDHYIAKYNSGVGFMAMQNTAGTPSLRSTQLSALYSYKVDLNENWTFIPGLQATYVNQNLNFSKLTFPDQFTNSGYSGGPSGEPLTSNVKSYMDFSAGGLLYSNTFWVGTAYHHLNHPNQAFSPIISNLPGELNIHAGARIPIENNIRGRTTQKSYAEKAIIPSIIYESQGKFSQLDIGAYLLYQPVMIGVWYRGLPFKHYAPGYPNYESIVPMIGFNYKDFTFSYSYDFVISSLTTAHSGGANEVSIIYVFGKEEIKKPGVKNKRLPCPKFYRNGGLF